MNNIYLVTSQQELFTNKYYKVLDVKESIKLLETWNIIQCDSETNGRNPHLCDFLCFQFGNKEGNIQIIVDCTTIRIEEYKNILESKFTIWANGKFDLQFCYKHNIIPRRIYDVMIAEQVLYLGFPHIAISPDEYKKYSYDFPYREVIDKKTKELKYSLSFSLQSLVAKYCNEYMDKTVRGEIIWRGLDTEVILYAAKDVCKLGLIMEAQLQKAKKDGNFNAIKLECSVVPCMAYMEWCGIKLDETKWKAKMQSDIANRDKALQDLNNYCLNHPKLQKWVCKAVQLDLFEEINTDPYFKIDWQKDEAKVIFKTLGFNLTTVSKTTKQETESVMEKVLNTQKGIDDVFLKLYFDYQGYYKVCTSFGQGHLDLINPKTGRLHTNYWQIGTISSRMSSGGGEDPDIAKYKHLKSVSMINMQQLPHDEITRSCFISEPGKLFCSCDWAAAEARMGAEVYNEKILLDEFLIGSGDTHAAYAKAVWPKELEGIDTKEIKKKRPDLRNKVKAVEFKLYSRISF